MRFGNIDIPMERIQDFCQKWKIREFSLFGSVLRDDFRPDSDVDVRGVLRRIRPGVSTTLWTWKTS